MKRLYLFILLINFAFSQAPVPIVDQSRLVDWSNAGILPNTPAQACTVLNVLDYGAVPNNSTDDYPAINSAINAAKNINGLSIIYFPSGTYRINSPIILEVAENNGVVTFDGNIVFQGSGQNSILEFDLNSYGDAPFQFLGKRKGFVSVDDDIPKGSKTIIASSLNTIVNDNDWIHLREYNSPKTTHSHHVIGQISQIVDVNTGLMKDEASKSYSSNYDLRLYKIIPLMNVGIERLRIKRLDTGHSYDGSNILFNLSVNNWVKGVYFEKTCEHHVKIKYSAHIEISGCYFYNANEKGNGGWGYGVDLSASTTNCLVENNIFRKLRHAMIVQDGANCNVFGYNYSIDQEWWGDYGNGGIDDYPDGSGADLCIHGDYPYSNLFEGNSVVKIWADAAHGDNGPYNTLFRNHTHNERESYIWNADYTNFIGNSNSNGCDKDPSDFDEWFLYDLIQGWNTKVSNNVKDIYTNYYQDHYPWETWSNLTHGYWAFWIQDGFWGPHFVSHSFLNDCSYYYSTQPSFMNGYEWPPLGPYTNFDLDQYVDPLPDDWVTPAQDRYNDNGPKIYIPYPTQWPPQPLTVTISGPTDLGYNEQGTFTANPSGGSGNYTNYRWWERKDEGCGWVPESKSNNIIDAPPPGAWIERYSWEGQQTVQFSRTYDFSLKCEVTDSDNNTATDIHSVTVLGGFLAKAQNETDEISMVAVPEKV